MIDIFDTNNIEDIPISLIKSKKLNEHERLILNLFEKKSPLSKLQIIYGLFRLYQIEKPLRWYHAKVSYLIKKKFIKRNEDGLYEKI